MEQSDAERPAVWPTRGRLEVCENVFSVVSAMLGNHQNTNHNSKKTSKGPEDCSSLGKGQQGVATYGVGGNWFNILKIGRADEGQAYIKPRKPSISEGRHGVAEQSDAEENEEHLVILARKHTNARFFLKHVDTRNEEERGAKIDS